MVAGKGEELDVLAVISQLTGRAAGEEEVAAFRLLIANGAELVHDMEATA